MCAVAVKARIKVPTRFAFGKIMPSRLFRVAAFVFTDALCALVTFLLGGLVGIGTLVCAFGLGPFIQFFNGAFSEKVLRYKPVETA